MGTRGPGRTPTQILKMSGSNRAVAREGKEPKPDATKPNSTVKMTPQERRVYDKMCRMLRDMGLQASTDGNAIARYAKALIRFNTTCEFLEKHGESYAVYDKHADGSKTIKMMRRFPESTLRNELEVIILRLEREFGLTPSARASLEVDVKPSTSFAEKFIG